MLLRQPGVRQAVVLARDDPSGGHRLVAYVTPHAGFVLQPDLLRQALVAELPEIMLPASILVLLAFPMTPNGKVDRLALPDPRAAIVLPQTAGHSVASGTTPIEEAPPHFKTYSWLRLGVLQDFFVTTMPALSMVKSAAVIVT